MASSTSKAKDPMPIAVAILGAGLLIAIGIGVAGYLGMRRRGAARPMPACATIRGAMQRRIPHP